MSAEVIETREFLPGDHAAAAALWRSIDDIELVEGDAANEIMSYLERNPSLSRVALDNGKLIGAALCGHDGRRGFIYHLAVADTHRGRGIAKRLVNECIAGLRAAGVHRAIILVADDNAIGRIFWERNGWEVIDGAFPMTRDV